VVVCHCERVTSAVIAAAIAGGAATVDEVTGSCRAGGRCGSCRPTIESLLDASPEATVRSTRTAA
jgi:NAD(P)H-nitrite reductase large subunit